MKLSLIISYYNRQHFLENTLWSIFHMTCHTEKFEIIIVDDKSHDEQRAEPIVAKFLDKMDIKLFYRENKTGMNRGLPINIGVKKATGDIILVQDTDNLHVTSMINQMIGKFIYGWDMVMFPACFSLIKPKQAIVDKHNLSLPESILSIRQEVQLTNREIYGDGDDGWYCHSHIRPLGCGAPFSMKRSAFLEMGGFDEDFYQFWGQEDTDFMNRLKLRKMPWFIHDDMLCFHQNHYDPADQEDLDNRQGGWTINKHIWETEKMHRADWVANQGREWGVL